MMQNCTGKACRECPYKKSSTPGYFGGHDLEVFAEALTAERGMPCHMVRGKRACSGAYGVRVNAFKRGTHPFVVIQEDIMRPRSDVRELLFGNKQEFMDYHNNSVGTMIKVKIHEKGKVTKTQFVLKNKTSTDYLIEYCESKINKAEVNTDTAVPVIYFEYLYPDGWVNGSLHNFRLSQNKNDGKN